MMKFDRKFLLRALAGELRPGEEAALRDALARDGALRGKYDTMRAVADRIGGERRESFRAGFAGRVMESLAPDRVPATAILAPILQRLFFRLAPIGAAALIVLGTYNVSTADEGQSKVNAVLGLREATIEAAWTEMIYPIDE